jgi:MFS family permease
MLTGENEMPPVQNTPQSMTREITLFRKRLVMPTLGRLSRNVYLLLFFTLGKGFQLTIATLNISYYAHSLGYRPDFIGVLNAMSAIGSLAGAVPVGLLADRIGRKPVLVASALLTPCFLACTGLLTAAPLLLGASLLQGAVACAYWVTNIPILTESSEEGQRVGVLALNSFLLLGVGALGNLLGGAVPEFVAALLHVSAASTVPLRWGVLTAALFTLVFGLPLWFLHEPKRLERPQSTQQPERPVAQPAPTRPTAPAKEPFPIALFVQLLIPDLIFTMGEGSVVALIQLYFVLRFHLLPGPLGVIFSISGFAGGIFSLTSPLFVKRWGKLRMITTVQYVSAPLMLLIGYAPTLLLSISGEYARSLLRILIDPVYAAFAMERVSDRYRATLSGFYSVTWSIGFSIGPTIAGWLQTNVSLSTSFVFGAMCLTLAPSLLLLFFARKRSL